MACETDPAPLEVIVTGSPPKPATRALVTVTESACPTATVAGVAVSVSAGGISTVRLVATIVGVPVVGVNVARIVLVPTASALTSPPLVIVATV